MKKRKIKQKPFMIFFFLFLIFAVTFTFLQKDKRIEKVEEVEEIIVKPNKIEEVLSTKGFIKVEPEVEIDFANNVGIVTLKSECYRITAFTEISQAESILKGMEKIVLPRPTAHDIMRDIFETLGIEVLMVKVIELRGNSYIGRIILKYKDIILNLDSRPSDGIALAVRTNAEIYFNESLAKRTGQYIC